MELLLSHALEIANSLLLTFAATEAWITRRTKCKRGSRTFSFSKKHGAILGLFLAVNLFAFTARRLQTSDSSAGLGALALIGTDLRRRIGWFSHAHRIVRPVRAGAALAGTSGLAAMLVSVSTALAWTGILARRRPPARFRRLHAALSIATGLFAFGCFRFFGLGDDHLHHTEVLKIAVVGTAFFVLCYCDCRRLCPKLCPANFSREVGVSLLRLAPVCPFLAVLISTFFLFLVTVLGWIGVDTGRDTALNPIIYYTTLYGPFATVYFNVKQTFAREGRDSVLPSRRPGVRSGARRSRLLRA
jgi:hypothetical protein